MTTTAIILAAGEGKRMRSPLPKVMHEVQGRPMVCWAVDAARDAGAGRIVVVVGNGAEQVEALFADDPLVTCVFQEQRLGTGHAARIALERGGVAEGQALVLCGDTPLLRGSTLRALVGRAGQAGAAGGALLVMECADPTGYGRVLVDDAGIATAIVEHKDCTAEQLACTTCNAGVYCFDAALLGTHIAELTCNNAQSEYYLTDMVGILAAHGAPMAAVPCEESETMGVNTPEQLTAADAVMRERLAGQAGA